MSRDAGTPGENIQSSGSWGQYVVLPLAFVAFGGVVLLVLKGMEFVGQFLPDLPFGVDVLSVAVVVSVAFYAIVRTADVLRG